MELVKRFFSGVNGDRLAVAVGAVVGLALSAAVAARADCDCPTGGQCAYGTCCYSNKTCMPIDTENYRRCHAEKGQTQYIFCEPNEEVCPGEPCGPKGG